MAIDKRKPSETGKTGKIVFPDTRLRKIVVEPDEYAPSSGNAGIRVKPQGIIHRFDPSEGIKLVVESSEMSIHGELTPNNPTEITATAISSSMVEIAATVDTGGNDGVEIHHSTTQGGPYSLETTVEETDFPVQISGLASGTTHYFVLRAFLFDGVQVNASFTDEVSATTGAGGSAPSSPSQPQISEISRTATTMTLEATWTDVADETEYQWTAGSNDGTTWSDGGTIAADSTSVQFVATRTNADHTGFFCVKACNASGCSVNSCNGYTVAGNLTAPSSLSATNPSGSDVDLDWSDMSGATVADETAIERRLVGGSFSEIDTVAFGVTHYDDNGLADGSYEYRVRHRDTGTGDTSPYSSTDSVSVGGGGGVNPDYPNEPAGLSVIGHLTFENGYTAQVGEGWQVTDEWKRNNMEILDDATAPNGKVMRGKFPSGIADGISTWRFDLWGPTLDAGGGSNQYDEIYISHWIFIEGSNFENQTVGTKVYYLAHGSIGRANHSPGFLSGNFSDQAIMSNMTAVHYIYTNWNADGTDKGGGSQRRAPNLTNEQVSCGEWVQVEVYCKVNSITGSDWNDDGIFRQWVNGVQTHELTTLAWRTHAEPRGFYHLQFTPVWGGNADDVRTRDDYWRIADMYISGA